jgi:branched-chain amino acid transport system ATP-binding protein
MNVLSGAYVPNSGSVELLGEDVTHTDAAARCGRGLSRTHQIPRPFLGMTVFENVLVAATNGGGLAGEEAYAAAHDSLSLCGMLGIANRRAEQTGLLDRKRLELARALATRPKLLLLDEIGGGLTDAEAVELVDTIRVLTSRGIAIVWIEHIVHVLLQIVTRLVCMDAGKVIADGDPAAVMTDRAVMEAYLGRTPE